MIITPDLHCSSAKKATIVVLTAEADVDAVTGHVRNEDSLFHNTPPKFLLTYAVQKGIIPYTRHSGSSENGVFQ